MKKFYILLSVLLLSLSLYGQMGGGHQISHAPAVVEEPAGGAPSFLTSDGYTIGWYSAEEENVTKDGSDLVAQWDDLSGEEHHLTQSTAGYKPVWSAAGIALDGADDYLRFYNLGTLSQPHIIYTVMKVSAYEAHSIFCKFESSFFKMSGWDGGVGGYTRTTISAGTELESTSNTMPVNSFCIVRILFNGDNSFVQFNETTATTGAAGAGTINMIELGNSAGSGTGVITYKEFIIRNTADDATEQSAVYDYLYDKYF
jgi:hypothetical protein